MKEATVAPGVRPGHQQHATGAAESLYEFLVGGPYAGHFQADRNVGTTGARLLHLNQPAGHFPDPAGSDIVLCSTTRYAGAAGRYDLSAGAFDFRPTPGSFLAVAPGAAADYRTPAPMSGVVLVVPRVAYERELAELTCSGAPDFGRVHAGPQYDCGIVAALHGLSSSDTDADARLHGDATVAFILARLVQLKGEPARTASCGLGPERLARIVEYIHAHLDQEISLSALAGQSCLSVYHFARSFKQATGRSPAAFVHGVRVQRARELLAFTRLSLAEVGLACGFSNQAHFTTAFRHRLGVTPGAFRADVCGRLQAGDTGSAMPLLAAAQIDLGPAESRHAAA